MRNRVRGIIFFRMHRFVVNLLALMLFVAPVRSLGASSDPEIQAEFEAICGSLENSFDPFYGELRSKQLELQLQASIKDASMKAEDRNEARKQVELRAALGRELLKLDRAEEAVEMLTAAADGARRLELEASFELDLKVYLGLAHLQLAEDQNCVADHNAASCILPFRREAIHRTPEHTRLAGDVFLEIAKEHPRAVHTFWLLNLARMVSGDFPEGVPAPIRLPEAALKPEAALPLWTDRAPDLGIGVVDLAGGAVMDDFDGDGLLDLVSSTWDPCRSLKAFRNTGLQGDGRARFEDVTVAWGLDRQLGGLNLVHADFDNDRRLDLLVLRGAWMGELGRIRNSLLRNIVGKDGPRFVDVTRAVGLAEPAYPTQTAAWADFDSDGDLDLYIGNEDPDGKTHPSQLFRNDGSGADGQVTFTDIAALAGVANHRFAKSVAWGDFDDDGDPDLYVSNSGPNRLYRNNSGGSPGVPPSSSMTFTDVAPRLGLTEPKGRSFATWFFDFDSDGDLDLFVADFSAPVPAVVAPYFGVEIHDYGPRLYRNDGDGEFTDVAAEVGLDRPLLPMGANFGDLDNDGFLDVYLGTGEPGFEAVMPNIMLRNDRGARFQDVTFAGGFGQLQKGHGVAFGDIDNDGDQDLFHQLGGFFPGDAFANALYENPTVGTGPTLPAWITLRLVGRKANSYGIGARIEIRVSEGGKQRTLYALAGSGGSFGGSSLQQEIGLGGAEQILEVIVRWPGSGTVQRFREVAPNRIYDLIEGEEKLVPVALPRLRLRTSAR